MKENLGDVGQCQALGYDYLKPPELAEHFRLQPLTARPWAPQDSAFYTPKSLLGAKD